MTKKWLVLVSICTVVGLVMSACSSGSDDRGNDQKVTLTVWDTSVPDPAVTKKIDDAFMAANPNVTIKRVHQPAETFPTLLRSAMAAKKGPDVFHTFAGKYVLDFPGTRTLDDLMARGDEASLRGWKEAATITGNKHYFVPFNTNGTMLYYNKGLFRKAGLDPEAPPTTWDDFLTTCNKLKAAGIVPFAAGFKDGGLGALLVANMAPQYVSDDNLGDFTLHPKWANSAFTKSFGLLNDLYENGCFSKDSQDLNLFPDAINEFKSAKAAMSIGFIADDIHYTVFRKTAWGKADLGGAMFPLVPGSLWDEQRLQAGPSSALAITKFSKSPKVAYEYARFFANKANGELLFKEAGGMPNDVDARPKSDDPVANEILGWLETKKMYVGPIGVEGANVEGVLLKLIPGVISGKDTWASVADQVQSEQDKADK